MGDWRSIAHRPGMMLERNIPAVTDTQPNIGRVNWFRFAAPPAAYALAGQLVPWLAAVATVLTILGLYLGLFVAPTDFQQGDAYRILFVHVPAAWLSMLLYLAMAGWAGVGLVWNTRVSAMMAQALAPTGALFTVLALLTGALWGRPTWGAWWVWDARLTSELLLLFLYMGYLALRAGFDDVRRADRASALLALIGVVNVPVIYFSVQWWNTLHQGATIRLTHTSMAPSMLAALLLTTFGLWAYAGATVLRRLRCILLERERRSAWVAALGATA